MFAASDDDRLALGEDSLLRFKEMDTITLWHLTVDLSVCVVRTLAVMEQVLLGLWSQSLKCQHCTAGF